MNSKADLAPQPEGNEFVDARLKKLRRERQLIERAIIALTEISRTRQSPYRHVNQNSSSANLRQLAGRNRNVSLDNADPRRNSITLPAELS
jgi:hypothetical protein